MRNIINIALTLIILGLFPYNNSNCQKLTEQKAKFTVYYFHHTMRCESCIRIENYSFKVLQKEFPGNLKDSSILWKVINVDDTENEHFIDDYKLETQALIISKQINGKEAKWKDLDAIWDHLNDYEKFCNYMKNEIKAFIK